MPSGEKTREMFKRAQRCMPYGVTSNYRYWGDVACIIMEPVMGNCASIMPKEGYLEFVRKLCDQYGIALIFDEVKTGFRIAKGGAKEYFNVKADLGNF